MQTVDSGFWPVAGSRIGVTLSSSSSRRLSSAGIGSVGRRIGDGDLYVPVRRSLRPGKAGRRPADQETRQFIGRLAQENPLWGQRRIQAELARLGIRVCARTVAKYMRRRYSGTPSPGWRQFLTQNSFETWACDLLTVQTLWFRTLFVLFVIHHGTRQIVHARVTAHPNAHWLAQQMVEACGPETDVPRFLIHDRDSCFGPVFDRRVASLGIRQI